MTARLFPFLLLALAATILVACEGDDAGPRFGDPDTVEASELDVRAPHEASGVEVAPDTPADVPADSADDAEGAPAVDASEPTAEVAPDVPAPSDVEGPEVAPDADPGDGPGPTWPAPTPSACGCGTPRAP